MNTQTTQAKYPPFFRLSNGCTRYGAQLGRRNVLPEDHERPVKLRMRKLRLMDYGAYDEMGAYWGLGNPIYFAASEDTEIFVRASSRDSAKQAVRAILPAATFHR